MRSQDSLTYHLPRVLSLNAVILRIRFQHTILAGGHKHVTHSLPQMYSRAWKRPWCWEGLRARGEGGDRGWDGWMASLTQWTWVWANSGRWSRTGRPGVLQSMRPQRAEIWLSGDQLTTYSDPSRNWTYCLQVRPAESQTIIFSVFCLFVFCFVLFCFTFWPHHGACGILVPRPGIKPMFPAFKSWSLNHWTTREVSGPLSSDMRIQEGEE